MPNFRITIDVLDVGTGDIDRLAAPGAEGVVDEPH